MNFAFVHGGGQGGWVWRETIAALTRQSDDVAPRCLSLDVAGCGAKRGQGDDGMTLVDVAEALIADIEASGMREIVLVGHSQGGQAMALMVGMRPDLFRRLIYIACSIPLPGQSVQEMIGNRLQGSHPDEVGWPVDPQTTTLEERYTTMFCGDMAPDARRAFLLALGHDRWPIQTYAFRDWSYDHLGVVPATFVLCLRDRSLPLAWQEVFARRFGVERTVAIDAGHQAMMTRPHGLAEILRYEAINDGG